jgi:hypothetical protein
MSGSIEPPMGAGPLDDTVRGTDASVGAFYLIDEAEPLLRLAALCGLPGEFTTPWQRLPLTAPVPVADALHDDRFVWIGGQEELARRPPWAAAVLPYPDRKSVV